jgi:hypothetical protein
MRHQGVTGREKRSRGWVGQHAGEDRYTWKGEEDGLVSTLVRTGIPGREKRMGWSARW